jgi:nucleoid DNA-binding protein
MGLHERTILQVAKEEGISYRKAENIINSQFEFVLQAIQEPQAVSVRLTYLGKFSTTDKHHAKYREIVDKKYGTS